MLTGRLAMHGWVGFDQEGPTLLAILKPIELLYFLRKKTKNLNQGNAYENFS